MATSPKNIRPQAGAPSHELDPVDLQLVDALQRDAAQRLEDLAALVQLAPSTVHERIRRLEREGIIRRWTIDIEAREVGLHVLAFIGVRATKPCSELRTRLEALPQIEECHTVAGAMSMLLKVRVRDTAGLLEVSEQLRQIPGIVGTESTIVLQTQFDRPIAFPLPTQFRSSG